MSRSRRPLTLDTTRPELIAAAAKRANDVTLLVNNAGVLTEFDFLTTNRSEFDADFRTNVCGKGVIAGIARGEERHLPRPDGAAD